eukprot:364749-Chlamydomonas_euryale.AAC.1
MYIYLRSSPWHIERITRRGCTTAQIGGAACVDRCSHTRNVRECPLQTQGCHEEGFGGGTTFWDFLKLPGRANLIPWPEVRAAAAERALEGRPSGLPLLKPLLHWNLRSPTGCTYVSPLSPPSRTCADVRRQQAPFTERVAAQILHSLMLFLVHMHTKGMAHMDIKPENIMFDSEGTRGVVKVRFGCLGVERKGGSSRLGRGGGVVKAGLAWLGAQGGGVVKVGFSSPGLEGEGESSWRVLLG